MSMLSFRRQRAALFLLCLVVSFSASCAPEVDVEKLYVQANSEDYEERVEARQRLAALVEKGDVGAFARGLKSPNAETRVQSILHLFAMQSPESKKPLVAELELSRRFNVFYNPIRLVPVSVPADSRIMIANILRTKGGDPGAVPVLAGSYGKEPDPETRVGTLYALGALHDPAAVPTLRLGLKDKDLRVVKAAVEGLAQIPVPDVARSLLEVLSDPSEDVRANSAAALGGFHDSGVSAALLQAVQKDPATRVRLAALSALPNAGGFPTFGPILSLLKDPKSSVELKEKAATALQSLTGQDFGGDAARWAGWWEKNKAQLSP